MFVNELFYALFGCEPSEDDWLMFFSVRLDESGTDGNSPYVVVAGAVAVIDKWRDLEFAWNERLRKAKVSAFHTKEVEGRDGDFSSWSNMKCERFKKSLQKIIKKHYLQMSRIHLKKTRKKMYRQQMKR